MLSGEAGLAATALADATQDDASPTLIVMRTSPSGEAYSGASPIFKVQSKLLYNTFFLTGRLVPDDTKYLRRDAKEQLTILFLETLKSEESFTALVNSLENNVSEIISAGPSVNDRLEAAVRIASDSFPEMKIDFADAVKRPSVATNIKSPSLSIPEEPPVKYAGKKVSGDIYSFLQTVYEHRDSRPPLTLKWLREHDERALTAFRNQRKVESPPPALLVLTDPERGSKMRALLEKHDIDTSTASGVAEAKRVMGAISKLIYSR